MKFFSLFLLACILFLFCTKKSEDTELPQISFTSPNNNQVFNAGELIHIKGTVTDNNYVDQIHIEISNVNTGEEYQHVHIHPGTKSYSFDQSLTTKAGIQYKIKVIAEDPASNTHSSVLQISSN